MSPPMMRWRIKMSPYDDDLISHTEKKHPNADALKCLPLDTSVEEPHPPRDVLTFEALLMPPLRTLTVASSTQECTILNEVCATVQEERSTESRTHRGCVTLGSRVVAQCMSYTHGCRTYTAVLPLSPLYVGPQVSSSCSMSSFWSGVHFSLRKTKTVSDSDCDSTSRRNRVTRPHRPSGHCCHKKSVPEVRCGGLVLTTT